MHTRGPRPNGIHAPRGMGGAPSRNRSGAKRAVITHLYPACDRDDVVGRIREGADAEVIGAEDLLTIDV